MKSIRIIYWDGQAFHFKEIIFYKEALKCLNCRERFSTIPLNASFNTSGVSASLMCEISLPCEIKKALQTMVEIFVTNVVKKRDSVILKNELQKILPDVMISFDLEDSEKILRIEQLQPVQVNIDEVISCVVNKGFDCKLFSE